MKKITNMEELTDREWAELASSLSGENTGPVGLTAESNIEEQWKGISKMKEESNIDVEQAWNKVHSRMLNNGLGEPASAKVFTLRRASFLKIAATLLILTGLGVLALYLGKGGMNENVTIVANADQRNLRVSLPDGSIVVMNRNSSVTYPGNFGKEGREVTLRGEAFFDITPDVSKPFIIDAGKASIMVVGTSFNVITENEHAAVEVFVKTGKVILEDKSGEHRIELEPGYIGKMNEEISGKELNTNLNYLSWNTGKLIYDGEKLDAVFRDLKKAYNMEIVADDPAIPENRWTSVIEYESEEKIILLICTSFNLGYTKDGNVYHLKRK